MGSRWPLRCTWGTMKGGRHHQRGVKGYVANAGLPQHQNSPPSAPAHLDTLAQNACQVVHPPAHQRHRVVLERLHAELGEVGLEGDASPVVGGLAVGDLGRLLDRHVGAEDLAVAATACPVARLDHELGGEDVGQLGSVAVPASGHLQPCGKRIGQSSLPGF